MATIQYEVPNNVQRMTIGVQGENNVREFLFDVTEWRQITGNIGAAEMVVQRNGDASPYAAAITMHNENTVSWVPTSTDTAKVGAGKLQLMWIASGQTIKTKIFDMKVDPSLDYAVPDTSLDPWASWMPDIINADANYKGLTSRVDDLQQRQTSPYNYKGSCAEADLPSSAEVNDTWYLTDRKYRVTWTGEEWQQSSMDESDYEDELADLKNALSVHRFFTIPNITAFEKGGWSNGVKSSFRQANRARTVAKFYCIDTVSIALKNPGTPLIYIEKYDSVGTRTEVITWTTQAIINKGDIVTITLSMGNTGDATETSLEDIFNTFSFLSVTPVVADTANLTFRQGLISTANAIATFYKSRIYTHEYIPVPDKLIYFSIETGYRAYIVTYNDSFNIIDYGVGGWLTGNIWKDLNGARYYRVMVSKTNDEDILPSEATALNIKTFPTVNSKTLIAISKDGINDSGKEYAPSYPKSSIVSFKKAILQGFNAIELHVQITSDGIPVLLHQQNINGVARNPDGTEISQTVSVSGSTLEQLNQYDFGILYGQEYAGTKILTLEQGLKFCKDKGVYAFIEPVTTLAEENETIVCNLLKKYGLQNQCGYFAYDGPVLVRIKNKIPTAMLYIWRNNNAQMANGISYVTTNLKTDKNRVFYYTYAETEIAEETIQNMASANIELMLQHLSDEEPVNIETTGNIYSSARVTQIVPATSVFGLI